MKTKILLSMALIFLGVTGFGQGNPESEAKSISSDKTLQAWIYPDDPNKQACNTENELYDGRIIETLKPEYLTIDKYGVLHVIKADNDNSYLAETDADYLNKCNGFSITQAQNIISHSTYRFITISGSRKNTAGFDLICNNSTIQNNFIVKLKQFLQYMKNNSIEFDGIELDIECHWSTTRWNSYKNLISSISSAIKTPGTGYSFSSKLLIVDGPAIPLNTTSNWDYSFFDNSNSGVDFVCVMAYDNPSDVLYQYQLAHPSTSGNPTNGVPPPNFDFGGESPDTWVGSVIDHVKLKMSNSINKIIIGMPSYGYHAIKVDNPDHTDPIILDPLLYTFNFNNDAKNDAKLYSNYNTATRDNSSNEMKFNTTQFVNIPLNNNENHPVYYQDAIGMSKKIEFIRSKGIRHVSVWCLGGNDWFTRFNINNNQITDNGYKLPTTVNVNNWDQYDPLTYPNNCYYDANGKTKNLSAHVSTSNVATTSSPLKNYIEFSGYNFGLPSYGIIDGFEVAVIGHSRYNSSELNSSFSIELYNGAYSNTKTFTIHSQQDIINIIGNSQDKWGLNVSNNNLSNFKVRIILNGGASAFISAVYVKLSYHGNCGTPYTHTVSGVETWNTNMLACQVITIPANAKLIINSEASFLSGGYIDVKKGGTLIVDGGTLTSCDNSWGGIIVEGDCTIGQYSTNNHGTAILKNGATIKNAIKAIKTYNIGNLNGGGIIYADDANFINNKISVEMRDFQNISGAGGLNSDYSYFKQCNFIKDDNYTISENFVSFMELSGINGIDIKGCKFANYSSNIPVNFSNAGVGIRANNSTFNIEKYINRQPEFYNLRDAVYQNNTILLKRAQIKNAIFANNFHAIFCNNSSMNWFTSNTFQIPYYYIQSAPGMPNLFYSAYGVFLLNSTGYVVEGNTFDKIQNSTVQATFGLIVQGTANYSAVNKIYNNTFSNFQQAATHLQGKNRGGDINTGLKILCNQYSSNNQDIFVYTSSPTDGISEYQGTNATTNTNEDKKKPAGNTFSKYDVNGTSDIFNGALNFTYFHHHSNSNADIWNPYYCNKDKIDLQNTTPSFPLSNRSLACPGIALTTGTDVEYPYNKIELNNLMGDASIHLKSAELILDLWKDGGNTELLQQEIETSYPWEAYILYNDLLLSSPYLSDDVLVDAIQREDVLPPLMLKLILLANPQATRSDRVWEALNARNNPLPESMIDEINQGLDIISPLEKLEADVSYYAGERKTYLDLLKQNYMADSSGTDMENLIQLFENENDIFSRYEMVFAKIINKDYNGAINSLNDMEGMIDPEKQPEEMDKYEKMRNIIPILIRVESGEKTWETIENSDKDYLIDLSESGLELPNTIAIAARLIFDPTFVFEEPIYGINKENYKMAGGKILNKSIDNAPILQIAPNPADEFITVSYEVKGLIRGLRLQLTDALGKTVMEKELTVAKDQQMLIVEKLAKGNYICTIYNNGNPIKNAKFIKK